ncbi:putative F-box protein At5g55150 [Silene latifolia]|uniref:putative F-box protein At5g55150 n=1 Tax=Silene latifolia TaxID=37657 RepID=UPI003D76C81F
MSRWSNLHPDILSEIIERIKNPCDHIRCSSICSSWRSVAKRHRPALPHSIPGIMLSPRHSLYRNFIPLPHNSPPSKYIHHQQHLDLDVSRSDTCCGSYQGWLVLLVKRRSICLHNPFSKQHRLLPTLDKDVYKAVLSSSPSFDTNCVVLILFQTNGAAFCRLGDDSWKNLECYGYYSGFSDALFFGGKFYVVDDYGRIYACNVGDTILEQIEPQPSDISKMTRYKFYLVEIQGLLCRIVRKFLLDEEFYYNCDIIYADYDDRVSFPVSTREFRVSRMDRVTNKWVPVYNLGGYAIFLGCGNSFSLSELEMGGGVMKRNRIYFMDDRQMNTKHFGLDFPGRDMGIYDMMDMSIEPLFSDPLNELMDYPPAVWVTPLPW